MYSSTKPILKAAAALEKVAQIFEAEEQREQEKKASRIKTEYVDPIIKKASKADPKIAEKLAHTDPEVLRFFRDLAVDTVSDDNISLGAAVEKTASAGDDDPLYNFMATED